MLDIKIPSLKEYDTTTAARLAHTLKKLGNFKDIEGWDKEATEEVARINSAVETIAGKAQQLSRDIERLKAEHSAKPFLTRLFSSRAEQHRLEDQQFAVSAEKSLLEELSDRLQAAIDFTPDSADDLKELIKGVRQKKKELQTEKKAATAQMAEIRADAREQSINTWPGKYGKWDRRQIQLDKQAALKPQENKKAAIERQIIYLDQIAAWLERFK